MLLAKKYKDNDVVSFKLSSGEEILGRFVREDDTTMYITKPSVLMMNQQGMGMVPFMFTCKCYYFNSKFNVFKFI